MSRIGKRPIKIPGNLAVSQISEKGYVFKSSKGEANFNLPKNISGNIEGEEIILNRKSDSKENRALHGLSARLIRNLMFDLVNGTKKILQFTGTGFRAKVENDKLILNMGFSHEIDVEIPKNIEVKVVKNQIQIEGTDRAAVGQLAAKIREVKPPEVYKGKGIKYQAEIIKKKAGKAAQTTIAKA